MPEPQPRLTFGELANRVVAADDPEERGRLIIQLARGTRSEEQILAITDRLLSAGESGKRVSLEWVARIRGKIPASVVARVAPLLGDRSIPASIRIAAAARVLQALPDRIEVVKRTIRPLVAGLSPLRRLERLYQLQHQMERSRALDRLIERREPRIKMDCPRCGVRLPRIDMIKHLWHEHGLSLIRGKVRRPERNFEDLKSRHAESRDTTVLDRAGLIAGSDGLRAWAATNDLPADDLAPLLASAEEHRAGLCPGCLAELPEPLAPLLPPLALADARLGGDGYLVEIKGTDWFGTILVSTPASMVAARGAGGPVLGPRGTATVAAAAILLLGLLVVFLVPSSIIFRFALGTIGLAAVVYGLLSLLLRPPAPAEDRVIDAAWTILARRIIGSLTPTEDELRFLTRLCRASFGRGDRDARTGDLSRVIESSESQASRSDAALRLLAAARVLQVEDGAVHGRDRVAGLAAVAAAGLRGEQPIEFAEYAAECVLGGDSNPDSGDRARLRMLLIAAAFEAGMKPRNLIDLWAVAPALRRLMAVEPLHRLGLLHGVWMMEKLRQWERIAPAETVFELCRIAPNRSGRTLVQFPDLLLDCLPAAGREDLRILICARGVAVGGVMLADPDSEVRVTGGQRRGYMLVFGPHRIPLERRPPRKFAGTVREWLQFRATVLLPFIDRYLAPGPAEITNRVLQPFVVRCRCGVASAVAVGKRGRAVDRPEPERG
jgi:hypothetical protein